MVTSEEFRQSVSRFATGVTVVSTVDDTGNVHGMTANSFTSVCLQPPLLLICVDFKTHTHRFIEARQLFGINILEESQMEVSRYFARKPEDRTGEKPYEITISKSGLPIIEGSLAFFGCRVVSSHIHGDHTIYIGEVEELFLGEPGPPLVFFQSRFTSLQPQ